MARPQGEQGCLKNYLTYSFALRFQRSCRMLGIPVPFKERLLQSAEQLVQAFTRSVHARESRRSCAIFA